MIGQVWSWFYQAIGVSALISVLVWTCLYLYSHTVWYQRSMKIPQPIGLPWIGCIPYVINVNIDEVRDLIWCLSKCGERHQIGAIRIGPRYFVALCSAEAVEALLSSKEFIEKSKEYKFLHPWLGEGLLTSTSSKWFQRRKMLTPAFHFKILEDFMDVFNEQSRVMVQSLQKEVGRPEFNIVPYGTLATLDIICETAMGQCIAAQSQQDSEYVKAIYRISKLIQYRQARPWIHPDWIYSLTSWGREQKNCLQILHGFTKKVVQDRVKERAAKRASKTDEFNHNDVSDNDGRKRRLAFLDLLIKQSENNSQFTEKDMCEEVDTFMFEGHDTTAVAFCWCLYFLGMMTECQDKVAEELHDIFGESDRPVTSSDLTQMKYLEMCLKEALRLTPSVPIFGRIVKKEVQILDTVIPAGTSVAVVPPLLHQDKRMFPRPEIFNPDNFLPDRVQRRHPYAYVPFSAGPRNCIGQRFALMEEKVLLSTFLRKYRIEALDHPEDIVALTDLIFRPKDGLRMRIYPRTHRTQ